MAKIGYIQTTRTCNQKCVICSNPPTDMELTYEMAIKEVDELKGQGYEGVVLTGGEPTLFDKLPDLITYCYKQKIFPRIITNGQKMADLGYLTILKDAGLQHVHLSVYSCQERIQVQISQNSNSLKNIKKALRNLKRIGGITVDVNMVINKFNANHLSQTVSWLLKEHTFVRHFVFNNLDPKMNRATENPQIIPRLNDFELELHCALSILQNHDKTFRVEKVPLCYLTNFEHVSTETRKIIKKEEQIIYFLDKRHRLVRAKDDWYYQKGGCCAYCSLNKICAGLYAMGQYYEEKELYPVFIDPEEIVRKVIAVP